MINPRSIDEINHFDRVGKARSPRVVAATPRRLKCPGALAVRELAKQRPALGRARPWRRGRRSHRLHDVLVSAADGGAILKNVNRRDAEIAEAKYFSGLCGLPASGQTSVIPFHPQITQNFSEHSSVHSASPVKCKLACTRSADAPSPVTWLPAAMHHRHDQNVVSLNRV